MPLVCAPSMATPPISSGGGAGSPRRRAHSRPSALRRISQGSTSTATIRMRPRKAGTAPGGSCATACIFISTSSTSTMRVDRHALAQHLVDEHDEDDAERAAEDAAAAAEDRGAADDDRGDDDELEALAGLGDRAAVLGHLHQPADAWRRSAESR